MARTASHSSIPPKLTSATVSHDEPAPKRPTPNAKPCHAAVHGESARSHSDASTANVTKITPDTPNGANAKTPAAPATKARISGRKCPYAGRFATALPPEDARFAPRGGSAALTASP